ncbi:hypothetical protein [Inquilinus sp. CA228]|uniref:hypothetical protein n=1 Tax=Inquilinus sp. CA228 TaxID=3455609 RepID=UPI003F8D1BA1
MTPFADESLAEPPAANPDHPAADPAQPAVSGWAIVELMGRRIVAGRVSEQVVAGAALLRVDIPGPGDDCVATQFYGGASIYCLTPCDEAVARKQLRDRWELPPVVRLVLPEPKPEAVDAPDEDEQAAEDDQVVPQRFGF